jgi:hypothetical protein
MTYDDAFFDYPANPIRWHAVLCNDMRITGAKMAGKYLKPGAITDTIISEQRMNAQRKRRGLIRHPIRAVSCGCPDENCGAFHLIDMNVTIPSTEECIALLAQDKRRRRRMFR